MILQFILHTMQMAVSVICSQKKGHLPWYDVPGRKTSENKIVFGHWSTLFGQTSHPNVYALDTGCLWGGRLTAMQLDSPKPVLTAVNCDS